MDFDLFKNNTLPKQELQMINQPLNFQEPTIDLIKKASNANNYSVMDSKRGGVNVGLESEDEFILQERSLNLYYGGILLGSNGDTNDS